MAITTYTELRSAIADWLNRADLDAQIPDFIALAESTLNRVLRDGRMVTSASLLLSSGAIALSTDALDVVYVNVSGDNTQTLEQVSPTQMMILRRSRLRAAGAPRFFAMVGRSILVAPIPSSATTLVVNYFQTIPPLASNSTNWLLTYHPDLYLYVSLMHAAPFLKDEARFAVLQGAVASQIRDAAMRSESLSLDTLRVPGISLLSPGDMAPPPPVAVPPRAV